MIFFILSNIICHLQMLLRSACDCLAGWAMLIL